MPRAIKEDTKEEAIKLLKEIFHTFTTPIHIYSDQGQHFNNEQFKGFLMSKGVGITFAGSGPSKSVGMIEVSNRILQQAIKKAPYPEVLFSKDDYKITTTRWDMDLAEAASNINERCIMHLMASPKQLLLGTPSGKLGGLETEYPTEVTTQVQQWVEDPGFDWLSEEDHSLAVSEFVARREGTRDRVQCRDTSAKQDMKARYDRRVRTYDFTPGEAVMLWFKKKKGKLKPQWRGPFVVTGYANEFGITYAIRQLTGKRIKGSFHGDHLRKFRLREGYLIPPIEADMPDYQLLRESRRGPPAAV